MLDESRENQVYDQLGRYIVSQLQRLQATRYFYLAAVDLSSGSTFDWNPVLGNFTRVSRGIIHTPHSKDELDSTFSRKILITRNITKYLRLTADFRIRLWKGSYAMQKSWEIRITDAHWIHITMFKKVKKFARGSFQNWTKKKKSRGGVYHLWNCDPGFNRRNILMRMGLTKPVNCKKLMRLMLEWFSFKFRFYSFESDMRSS